jgi:hypothetical protein
MPTMSEDVAKSELDRFFSTMDLQTTSEQLERDDPDELQRIVGAMVAGNLHVNEDGCPVFRPKMGQGEAITFYEPTGASYMAMDKVKKDAGDIAKMYAFLADQTQTSRATFAGMANRDVKICHVIAGFFIGG